MCVRVLGAGAAGGIPPPSTLVAGSNGARQPHCSTRMAHIPNHGARRSIAAFHGSTEPRHIFLYIEDAYPLLDAPSPERRAAAGANRQVGFDDMEIAL